VGRRARKGSEQAGDSTLGFLQLTATRSSPIDSHKMHSHHPKSYMAAQICHKGGKLEMKEVDWRQPRKDEIVVKVMACGVARR